jgi:hypothetical protein
MSEPYKMKKIPDHWKTSPKRMVVGNLVALSGLRLTSRGTWLMHPQTRACPKYSILELTITDEENIGPGTQVNSVLYIGFLEVATGSIIVAGEPVRIQETNIGSVAGFSDIHCPNHLNVMVAGTKEFSSKYIEKSRDSAIVEMPFKLEDKVVFGREYKS